MTKPHHRGTGRVHHSFVFLGAALLGILLPETAFAQSDGLLVFNQKFKGLISASDDLDLVEFEEVVGSKLTLTAKASKKNQLKPSLELLDNTLTPINVGTKLKYKGKTATIKKFEAPYTGTYYARIGAKNGNTGTYRLSVTGSPRGTFKSTAAISLPGEIDEVLFDARAGSKVTGYVKRASGDLIPIAIELVAPGGVLVAFSAGTSLNSAQTKLSLNKVVLPLQGEYRLRITGQGGTAGDYSTYLKVTKPKTVGGAVYEDEHPNNPGVGFSQMTLSEVRFGRGLKTSDGLSLEVVSPLSIVRLDPISDLPVPGTLKPLFQNGDLSTLTAFNMGPLYGPPVVARNATLVLEFSHKPSLASLNLDTENLLTAVSPIQITVNDVWVPLRAFVQGKKIYLNPSHGDQVGFPASPVAFDSLGNPAADVLGSGKLEILSTGDNVLLSLDGGAYRPRADLLGSSDVGGTFIGFNPGNQVLDFFEQFDAGVGGKTYGGFLPDEYSPRVVRRLSVDGTYSPDFADPQSADIQGADYLSLVSNTAFSIVPNQGEGEWARGVLRLRPNSANPEDHIILQNTVADLGGGFFRNDILLADTMLIPLAIGDEYSLLRSEYYEPDLDNPLDLELFDPNNPELINNTIFSNFVEAIDRNGVIQDVSTSLDSRSEFTFRFSEPMLLESFRPYETFFVTDDLQTTNPEDYFDALKEGLNVPGIVASSDGGKAITFRPYRKVEFGPFAGNVRLLGLGNSPRTLVLHLKVSPPADILEGLLGVAGLESYINEGHRGITDLGGQPLAFPVSFLSSDERFVDYSMGFTTLGDPLLQNFGAVVQRFLGAPNTGFDGQGNTGITFADVPTQICGEGINLYGPRIADLNLFTNGFLSGSPVQFFTKIHDDFNPPPTGQMNPFPFGTSTPIGGFAVLGGARFQHVFRAVDASPDWENLAGTNLDLYHMAFAPIGGFVTDGVLPDISIHAGHTANVPDTRQGQGIPSHPSSGLNGNLNTNYDAIEAESGVHHPRQLLSGTDNGGNSYTGVQFSISNNNLFSPLGSPHAYHPLPDQPFMNPYSYNNGTLDSQTFDPPDFTGQQPTWGGGKGDNRPQSLLLEYRVRVVDPLNPPVTQNGFTFAVGILASAIPRFRVYSIGTGCMACCFPGSGGCTNNCVIAYGPAMDGQPGNGGTPLEPDQITRAGGPAPAPPGMQCVCLRPPQNPATPPAGCVDNTPASPNIQQVAYSQATNPNNNNFGDNSRYFMVFNYVKRESMIRSPFIRTQPATIEAPTYLDPVFDPPLLSVPVGTVFDIKFRSSPSGGSAGLDASAWVTPSEMTNVDNPINPVGVSSPYLQFEVEIEANTSTQLTPVFDEIVVPFRTNL